MSAIGFVFRSTDLIGELNVLENAEPALRHPSDAPASEGRNRVSEALEKIKPGHHAPAASTVLPVTTIMIVTSSHPHAEFAPRISDLWEGFIFAHSVHQAFGTARMLRLLARKIFGSCVSPNMPGRGAFSREAAQNLTSVESRSVFSSPSSGRIVCLDAAFGV